MWNQIKSLLFLSFLTIFHSIYSQPIQISDSLSQVSAIVIGINKYQNQNVPNLIYAAKDALDFESYLILANMPTSNITTLIETSFDFKEYDYILKGKAIMIGKRLEASFVLLNKEEYPIAERFVNWEAEKEILDVYIVEMCQ